LTEQAARHARSMPLRRAIGTVPVPVVGIGVVEKHVAEVRARALAFARALRRPPFHPETEHRLRTHLRRLQAYAEFLQRPRIAARLAECVSWLSDLRALYVFQQYLRRRRASVPDRSRVDRAVRDEERAVARAGYPEAIRTRLAGLSITRMRRPSAFLAERLASLSRDRAVRLDTALRGLSPEATRKELHRLRLLIKSLRYQEEIAFEAGCGNSKTVAALKRLQRTLGDYCDRDQFRRLARKLDLACRSEMKKEYRRYRQRARAAVRKLGPPQSSLIALR
jgi:CHAD domain-containing protein